MSKSDKGIDWYVTTTPWCMKLEDYVRQIGLPTDSDEDPNDG